MGKTRLSLAVAASLTRDFLDGVAFVSLVTLRDPQALLPALAHAFQRPDTQSLRGRLYEVLRARDLLLVLDNFEHLIAAAPSLSALLTNCGRLKVLVTSRARLHVRGERLFPLMPLALPDPSVADHVELVAQGYWSGWARWWIRAWCSARSGIARSALPARDNP